MKAIVVPRPGGPEVLEYRDVPDPQPKEGNVVVRVEAAGINFADTLQTRGLYPGGPRHPYTPGLEFAGVVEGSGERVMGTCAHGGYAEKVLAHRAGVWPLPASWSAEQGAAFPVNYMTAWFAYWMAGFLPESPEPRRPRGRRVLIHAAAGGVGTAAVEMGTILGLETFGTSSSDDKLDKLRELGLVHAINYRNADYEEAVRDLTRGHGVDAVFEMLGGEHTAKSTRCLAPLGQLVVYGTATGRLPQFDFMTMFQKNLSAHVLWLSSLLPQRELVEKAYKAFSGWISAGKIRPIVGHVLPLERAADAHRLLLERRNYGKVVLKP